MTDEIYITDKDPVNPIFHEPWETEINNEDDNLPEGVL